MISFTIDGVSYQAEDGMTWQQWVGSKYNTGNWSISDTSNITNGLLYIYLDGKIVVATDVIVFATYTTSGGVIEPPVVEPLLIDFTIRGITGAETFSYQAEDGMTWADWVNSEYNTDGYKVDTNSNVLTGNKVVTVGTVSSGGSTILTNVKATDLITSDATYKLVIKGGGGGAN